MRKGINSYNLIIFIELYFNAMKSLITISSSDTANSLQVAHSNYNYKRLLLQVYFTILSVIHPNNLKK